MEKFFTLKIMKLFFLGLEENSLIGTVFVTFVQHLATGLESHLKEKFRKYFI